MSEKQNPPLIRIPALTSLLGLTLGTGLTGIPGQCHISSWIFFANHDVSGGSLFCYKKRDDYKLYSGPVWDYDKSMTGNYYDDEPFPWYGRTESILWYPRLDQYDDFHDMVVEDYRGELSPIVGDIIDNKIPDWLADIGPSVKMDEIRWNRESGYKEKRASEVTKCLSKRIELFDSVWIKGEDSPYSDNIY